MQLYDCVAPKHYRLRPYDFAEGYVVGNAASKLIVSRPYAFYVDRLRVYKIYVDNVLAGKVAQNSIIEIDILSGYHSVIAKIDWCRSKPLNINALSGQTIRIEVNNQWGSGVLAITFGANSYLNLQEI